MNCQCREIVVFFLVSIVSCSAADKDREAIATEEVSAGWKVPFDGSGSHPVVHNGTIYIGSFNGSIYAIDPNDGNQVWRYQTGVGLTSGPEIISTQGGTFEDQLSAALTATEKTAKGKREIVATPVIENETVYIGSKDFNFYALDAKTGRLKWATGLGQPVYRKALVTNNHIIVHGLGKGRPSTNAIYTLSKNDGQVVWTTKNKGSATYPSSSGDIVYYGISEDESSNFTLNAVEVKTAKALWATELPGRNPERVYRSGDFIYVSAYKGGGFIHSSDNTVTFAPSITQVYAVNALTGEIVWNFEGGETGGTSPPLLVSAKYIFFPEKKGLYALDKNTGKQHWFLEGRFSKFQIIEGKYLYAHGDSTRKDEHMYAIDTETGKVIWSYKDKNLFYTILHADTLYVSAEKGLLALDSDTGKKLWKFKTGDFFKAGTNVSALPVIFENQVIFPTETNVIWGQDNVQGHLYSIDARTGRVN